MEIEALHLPLTVDAQGTLRVGGTRVTLDVVVTAFEQGATPEEIVQDFPVLSLADVYAVLTYYLQHRESVDAYLSRRRFEAAEIRMQLERHAAVPGLRDRLQARQRT